VIDESVAGGFRGRADLDAVAAQAREFRGWLRGFIDRHAGRAVGGRAARELGPLNALLAQDDSRPEVVADGGRLAVRRVRQWDRPEQLLQPLAGAAADLVCHADFRLVRACEGAACSLVFLDRTRSHARRWCSMAVCGNRAKAAAHRARVRGTGD
jgi:predicted RNA-binding Zn ribbon-like protein